MTAVCPVNRQIPSPQPAEWHDPDLYRTIDSAAVLVSDDYNCLAVRYLYIRVRVLITACALLNQQRPRQQRAEWQCACNQCARFDYLVLLCYVSHYQIFFLKYDLLLLRRV